MSRFSYNDMELSGFSSKYLDLHQQIMPDNSVRNVLRAGMYGLGPYSKGSWIQIDPSTGTKYSTDNYDLYKACGASVLTTYDTYMKVGIAGGYQVSSAGYSFIAFNTGINDVIASISSPSMYLYYTTADTFDTGEGVSLRVYNIVGSGDGADSNTAKEDSTSRSLGINDQEDLVWGHQGSAGYKSANTIKLDNLLEYWADERGSSENWISFKLEGCEMDNYQQDDAYFTDSQYSGTSRDPKLTFSYTYAPILAITSVSVSDSTEKGDDVPFSITISNTGSGAATGIDAKITIKGDSYSWSGAICDFMDWDSYLAAGNSETHSITFDPVFNYGSKYYAWNAGDYKIDQVDVQCDGGFTASYTTDVPFDIDINSNTHVVFCVILEDTDFRNEYGTSINWNGVSDLSDGYGQNDWTYQPWMSTDWYYNTEFDIDLVPSVVSLYEFTSDTIVGAESEGYTAAKTVLGLADDWDGDYVEGTSKDNHGFDLLWCMLPEVAGPCHGGFNRIILRVWDSDHMNDEMFHIMQHELGHPYGAIHVYGVTSIMGAYEWDDNFETHEFTSSNYSTVNTNSDRYDEPV